MLTRDERYSIIKEMVDDIMTWSNITLIEWAKNLMNETLSKENDETLMEIYKEFVRKKLPN